MQQTMFSRVSCINRLLFTSVMRQKPASILLRQQRHLLSVLAPSSSSMMTSDIRGSTSYSTTVNPVFESMEVQGFPMFLAVLKTLQSRPPGEPAFVLFCGDPSGSAYSWCPDCVRSEPLIEQVLQGTASPKTMLCHARVGTMDEFKGSGRPTNMFVQHPEYQVTEVPTLMHVGSKRFLRGPYEVENRALLEEFVKSSVAMDAGRLW